MTDCRYPSAYRLQTLFIGLLLSVPSIAVAQTLTPNFAVPRVQSVPEVRRSASVPHTKKPAVFDLAPAKEAPTPEERLARQEEIRQQVENLPAWKQANLDGKLHLLLSEVVSPTEIKLLLSGEPVVPSGAGEGVVRITDSSGDELFVSSLYLENNEIIITTDEQVRGEQYIVALSEPLVARNGAQLDALNRAASVFGHADGLAEKVVVQAPAPVEPVRAAAPVEQRPTGIYGLELTTSSRLDGTYTLHVRWELVNPQGQLVGYHVRQSNDGGATISPPQFLTIDNSGIDIPGILPGPYSIGIQGLTTFGYGTEELFETIEVGPQTAAAGRPGAPQAEEPTVYFHELNQPERRPPLEPVYAEETVTVDAPEPLYEETSETVTVEVETIESGDTLPSSGPGWTNLLWMLLGGCIGYGLVRKRLIA